MTLYVDGREVDSGTGTAAGTFGTGDYSTSNSSFPFVVAENQHGDTYLTGYVSNLRVVDGRRLYTSNFTPPVHELEPINGTRILCCNNPDSVTAFSNAGIGTVRTVATGGNPTVGTASTEFPELTRDSHLAQSLRVSQHLILKDILFHHQARQLIEIELVVVDYGGGSQPGNTNAIEYFSITTQGETFAFGDLTEARRGVGMCIINSWNICRRRWISKPNFY